MSRLRKRRRVFSGGEAPKPMDGVANLSDAMLVFACGLMTAIAVNWNVDFKVKEVEVTQEQEITENELQEAISDNGEDSLFQEKGKVYVNRETGEMYMISE